MFACVMDSSDSSISDGLFFGAKTTGDTCRGSLRVLPAAVHAERTGVDRHLHSGGHARDSRMRRPGSHQHFYLGSQHGHEIRLDRRQVRKKKLSLDSRTVDFEMLEIVWRERRI